MLLLLIWAERSLQSQGWRLVLLQASVQPLIVLLILSAVLLFVTFVPSGLNGIGVKVKTCQSDFKTVIVSNGDLYWACKSWSPMGPQNSLGLTSHLWSNPSCPIPDNRVSACLSTSSDQGLTLSRWPGPCLHNLILRKGFCLLSWNPNSSNVHWLIRVLLFGTLQYTSWSWSWNELTN